MIICIVSLMSLVLVSCIEGRRQTAKGIEISSNSIVFSGDSIVVYLNKETPCRKAYECLKTWEEEKTEEKNKNTITYRYRELKEFADGTIISRPVERTVPAFVIVYEDGSKELTPIDGVTEWWYISTDTKNDEIMVAVKTIDGKVGIKEETIQTSKRKFYDAMYGNSN